MDPVTLSALVAAVGIDAALLLLLESAHVRATSDSKKPQESHPEISRR